MKPPLPRRPSQPLLALVLPVLLSCCLQGPSAAGDAVDDLVASELGARHLPGISVAVLRDGRVIKTATAGYADLELGVPVTVDTVFQIQSITKTFTAAGIQLLAREGRLGLDDPVAKHLPDAPALWKDITLRHLLNHTSGIKDFINEPTASLRLDVTEDEVLRVTAGRPLNFPPGERYAYSNTNYHLLAMILRRLAGKGYGDVLRERVFVPLDLRHTRILSLFDIIPARASGYSWSGTAFRRGEYIAESILSYGGGGLLSTATDLALWARAMLEARLIPKEAVEEAWTPGRLNDGKTTGYGLGWGISKVDGHREIGHSGAHVSGFTSSLLIYPEDRLAVAVLVNRVGADVGRIGRRIAGHYVPALAPRPAAAIEDREPAIAARLKEVLSQAPDWKFDPNRFTPAFWEVLRTQQDSIQPQARAVGELRSLELLSRTRSDGASTSRFRARFAQATLILTVVLEGDRIAGLDSDEEN